MFDVLLESLLFHDRAPFAQIEKSAARHANDARIFWLRRFTVLESIIRKAHNLARFFTLMTLNVKFDFDGLFDIF